MDEQIREFGERYYMLRDSIYGIPLRHSTLLLDVPQACEFLAAIDAYDRAATEFRQERENYPGSDPDSIRKSFIAEPAEHLYGLYQKLAPQWSLHLGRNLWRASGLAKEAGGPWCDIESAAWDHVREYRLLDTLEGRLKLAGIAYYGIRVRPTGPVAFETAALVFCPSERSEAYLRAVNRGDTEDAQQRLLGLRRGLARSIELNLCVATGKDEVGARHRIATDALRLADVGSSGSDIHLPDGHIIRDVRVQFPDPFAERKPVPVEIVNWPDPAPASQGGSRPRQAEHQQSSPSPKNAQTPSHRPHAFDRTAFDEECLRVQLDPGLRDGLSLNAYMLRWTGTHLAHHRDKNKRPSKQWVTAQLRRLRSSEATKSTS